MMNTYTNKKGFLLLGIIIFAAISLTTITVFISWGQTISKLSRRVLEREQSLAIAEAGIEYTRWYLAHYQSEYTLGNTGAGPYVYDFKDKNNIVIGTYTLTITPPTAGSTLVKIKSTGATVANPTVTRSIVVQIAIPSFAKYSIVANDTMRFGQGTTIYGPIHSNGGIRLDGVAWNNVTSSKSSYTDPDHGGANEFGVHTHVIEGTGGTVDNAFRPLEAPNATVPQRSDVFKAGRTFPVPAVDFVGITNDLATIKTQAQTGGRYFAASGAQGYQIILKINDTMDVYKVNSVTATPSNCAVAQSGWGTWSINSRTFLGNYPIPLNGLVFAEDNVWVEGTINTARVTIAAAKFPDNINTRKNIIINNNLKYTNYDGRDVIGLIAQNNISVGLTASTNLSIDAALIAQNGRIGRYYYGQSCGTGYTRSSISLYGILGTNLRYGFAYTDGTGYTTRIITYDTNLLYAPPPNFPLASDKYQIVSWEELKN